MIFKAILSNRTAPEYGHIKGVYKLHEMIAKDAAFQTIQSMCHHNIDSFDKDQTDIQYAPQAILGRLFSFNINHPTSRISTALEQS